LTTEAEHDSACAETQQRASLSAYHQLLPRPVDLLRWQGSCRSLCSEDEASDLKQNKAESVLRFHRNEHDHNDRNGRLPTLTSLALQHCGVHSSTETDSFKDSAALLL